MGTVATRHASMALTFQDHLNSMLNQLVGYLDTVIREMRHIQQSDGSLRNMMIIGDYLSLRTHILNFIETGHVSTRIPLPSTIIYSSSSDMDEDETDENNDETDGVCNFV